MSNANNPSAIINKINSAINNNPTALTNTAEVVNKAANAAQVVNKAANAAQVVNKAANAAQAVNNAAEALNKGAEVVNKAANAAEAVNKGAEAVNNAANAAQVVNKGAEALNKGAEVVNKAANAAEAVNKGAEVVNKAANAAEAVNKGANAASKVLDTAGKVAEAANTAANAAKNVIEDMPRFAYTGAGYWGGAWYPYWTLMIITVIGGFVGADHFWIRSPVTGILKFWINIMTMGAWYVYDIIQIYKDRESVQKNGLSIPVLGAQGIGAGIFTDGKKTNDKDAKSDDEPGVTAPWRWFVFLILVWYPFGLDSFIAGDGMGAMVKFIGTFIPLLWPIMMIWKGIDLYQTYISPTSIWSNGLIRFFPFSFIMNKTYPTKLGPSQPLKPVGQDGLLYSLGPIGQAVGIVAEPIIDNALAPVTAVTGAIAASANTLQVAANSTSEIIKAATTTAVPVVKSGSAIVQLAPKAVSALPAIASSLTKEAVSYSDPKKLAEMAVKQGATNSVAKASNGLAVLSDPKKLAEMAVKQGATSSVAKASNGLAVLSDPTKLAEMAVKQGKMVGGGATDTISMGAVILILSILLGGGLFLGGLRLKEVLKQNQNVKSKDDRPLETPRVRSFT